MGCSKGVGRRTPSVSSRLGNMPSHLVADVLRIIR